MLVVEGKDDYHAVKNLLRAYVRWPEDSRDAPVDIRDRSGKDAVFVDGYLSGLIKEPGMQVLGLLLDADDDAQRCYDRIRDRCLPTLPGIPRNLPDGGLIFEGEDAPRFGVWIMPDNSARGDLEVFLRYLVPARFAAVWDHAEQSTARARELGADYRDVHAAKANLHAWLAWQDPPGRPLGLAITERVLDPRSPAAQPFVEWFLALFRLDVGPA